MRSLRLHAPRDLRLHDEPIPEPGTGEVRIAVKSVGICASDLHYYRDGGIGETRVTTPIVIGHEASGVVTALGDEVTEAEPGDRVAIEPAKPCLKCEYCLSGHFNVCPGIPFFGTPPTDGCLRDYVTWPARLVIKVPDVLSADEAAMVEPLAIGVHAVELAELKPSDTVAILGAGAIGLSVLQAAKCAGVSRILVGEPVEARRALACRLGACTVVDPQSATATKDLIAAADGRGADVVFECAGEDDAVREACRIARVLGKVAILGIPQSDVYPFDASSARRKQLTAVFVRRSNLTTEKSIEMVSEGKADVACYATHRFPLEEAAQAMELALAKDDGVIRAVVAVSDGWASEDY